MGTALRRDHGIVVPVRAFRSATPGSPPASTTTTRAALARSLATRVVADAAGDTPVVVVTSAAEVVEWATELGAEVIDDPGSLDGAARARCGGAGPSGLFVGRWSPTPTCP